MPFIRIRLCLFQITPHLYQTRLTLIPMHQKELRLKLAQKPVPMSRRILHKLSFPQNRKKFCGWSKTERVYSSLVPLVQSLFSDKSDHRLILWTLSRRHGEKCFVDGNHRNLGRPHITYSRYYCVNRYCGRQCQRDNFTFLGGHWAWPRARERSRQQNTVSTETRKRTPALAVDSNTDYRRRWALPSSIMEHGVHQGPVSMIDGTLFDKLVRIQGLKPTPTQRPPTLGVHCSSPSKERSTLWGHSGDLFRPQGLPSK
jgi:hypothetical protein